MTPFMGNINLIQRMKKVTARNALVVLVALLAAFAPPGALAMGHCPAMTGDCYGPCATYACGPTEPPAVMAPPNAGDIAVASVALQPIAPFGTPDPPPRAHLSV